MRPHVLVQCSCFLATIFLLVSSKSNTVAASPASSPLSLFTSSAFLASPPPCFHKRLRSLRGGAAARSSLSQKTPLSPSTSSSPAATATASTSTALLAYNESSTDAGSLSIQDLFAQLQTSPTDGLTEEEAQRRLHHYGRNVLEQPPSKSVWQLILEQFEDRLVQILLAVALLSGIFSFLELQQSGTVSEESLLKSFVEPLVILAILILNAAVGVWQSQSASDSLEALQKMQPTLATVLRRSSNNGMDTSSPAKDGDSRSNSNNNNNNNNNGPGTPQAEIMDASALVPGDILELRVGDKIPADARLLSLKSSSLKVDEGSLTGESVTVGKLPRDEGRVSPDSPVQDQVGMLYSGTMVTSGSGVAVVVQTGMETQFGKVRQAVMR